MNLRSNWTTWDSVSKTKQILSSNKNKKNYPLLSKSITHCSVMVHLCSSPSTSIEYRGWVPFSTIYSRQFLYKCFSKIYSTRFCWSLLLSYCKAVALLRTRDKWCNNLFLFISEDCVSPRHHDPMWKTMWWDMVLSEAETYSIQTLPL